jgi:hypothetical protein
VHVLVSQRGTCHGDGAASQNRTRWLCVGACIIFAVALSSFALFIGEPLGVTRKIENGFGVRRGMVGRATAQAQREASRALPTRANFLASAGALATCG